MLREVACDVVDASLRRGSEQGPGLRREKRLDVNLGVDRAQALERIDEVRLFYRILRGFGEGDERVECRRGRQRDGAEKRRPGCAARAACATNSAVWPPSEWPTVIHELDAREPRSERAAATLSITAFASACSDEIRVHAGCTESRVVTRYDREVLCEQRAHFPHRIQIVSEIRRDGRRALIAEPGRSVRPRDDGPSAPGSPALGNEDETAHGDVVVRQIGRVVEHAPRASRAESSCLGLRVARGDQRAGWCAGEGQRHLVARARDPRRAQSARGAGCRSTYGLRYTR